MMTIVYRLDELLALRKMTARELSKRTKIATSTLSAIRRNEAERIDRSTLNRLCDALQCTPGDLISYSPDPVLPALYTPGQPSRLALAETPGDYSPD